MNIGTFLKTKKYFEINKIPICMNEFGFKMRYHIQRIFKLARH